MKTSGNIIKNTGAMLLGTIIRMLASLVLFVFLARKLGPAAAGEFSLVLTLFWVFFTMAGMGIQPLIIREVAKERGKTGLILTNAAYLALAASVLMTLVMVLFSYLMSYGKTVNLATWWMGLSLIMTTVSLVFQSIFIAWEKAELVLISMTWENVARLAIGIWVLLKGGSVIALSAVFALTSLLTLLINILQMIRKIEKIQTRIDYAACKWLLSLVPAFAGASITNTLFWNMDMLLLSRMATMEEMGIYSAPMRLVNVIKLVLQSYKVAIQPVAARLFLESRNKIQSFMEKSLFYVFIFTIPVCVGGLMLSDKLVPFIFGDAFNGSILVFRIVIWMLIPYGIVLVLAAFLVASHHQNVDFRINLISMFGAFILGFLLISKMEGAEALGAGLAVLGSVVLFMSQQILFIWRRFFRVDFWHMTSKILASAGVMAVVCWFLEDLHILLVILIAVVSYFGMLSALKVFSMKDIRYLLGLKKES